MVCCTTVQVHSTHYVTGTIHYLNYTHKRPTRTCTARSQDSLVSLLLTDGGEGEEEVRGVGVGGATVRAEGEELKAGL